MNKAVFIIIMVTIVSAAIVGAFVGLIVLVDNMVAKRRKREAKTIYKNGLIYEFAERVCDEFAEMAYTTEVDGIPVDILILDCALETVVDVARKMKGE